VLVRMQFASRIIYKEMFLTEEDLAKVTNEQSGLIDMLVMRKAKKFVGISVSTFSFFISELRLMDGRDPEDTHMLSASRIGTDELFYSCGVVSTSAREEMRRQGRLHEECHRMNGDACFTDEED
jgi:hypothetical protein